MKQILTESPFAEISLLGDFIVQRIWLSPTFIDQPCEQAYICVFLSDLEQPVQHTVRNRERIEDIPNT